MNCYFITIAPLSEINNKGDGVGKKIISQIKLLNESGISTKLLSLPQSRTIEKIISKLYNNYYFRFLPNDFFVYDIYYFRFFLNSISLMKLLKTIKKKRNKRIIIEIPTYPYEKSMTTFLGKCSLVIDKILRKNLRKYVDRIATASTHEEIFGIPTIHISHGVDCSSIPIRKAAGIENNILNLIGVAKFAYWHGYERLIHGLKAYYQTSTMETKVFLHFVGDGPELEKYKRKAKEFGIEKYILFYGLLSNQKLTDVFDKCDMGVSGLGLHRIGLHFASDLKSKEYLARGLPIIASCKIDIIPKEFKYCFYVPDNESPIDIYQVVNFYQDLLNRQNIQEITSEIRKFAEDNCDISKGMLPVIEYING